MTLDHAFEAYRAGKCNQAVALLQNLLDDVGSAPTSGAARGGSSELVARALSFLEDIEDEPTKRETAAALIMVGSLLFN